MDFQKYIGMSTGFRKIEYNWRDVALYALAVGAKDDEVFYFYEKDMKTLPTFGAIPYWNAINNEPQRPLPFAASCIFRDEYLREYGVPNKNLHMDHEIIMHRPIDPIKGTLVFKDVITDIYDRGEGKGVVVRTNLPVYDEAGRLLCENNSSTMFFEGGGFGGKAPPKAKVTFPDRPPDFVVRDYISKTQNFLYRLTGDTNLEHADIDLALKYGMDGLFLQGLCSYGFGCRMAIKAAIPGQPERVTRVYGQMRSVCYLGREIELQAWRDGKHRLLYRLMDLETQKPILDKCELEFY